MKPMQTYSKIEPAYADITYVYLVKKLQKGQLRLQSKSLMVGTALQPFKNKTEVTSVKLVVFKWEKLFDILT